MFRLSARRSLWAPSLIVIGASVGIASMLGITAGLRTWPLWVVLFIGILLTVAWMDRRLHPDEPRAEPAENEPERRRLRPPAAGKPYDLERDRSTDKQRFLM